MRARALAVLIVVLLVAGLGGVRPAGAGHLAWLGLERPAAAARETFEAVAQHVRGLSPDEQAVPLAVEAAEGGHWRLANRAGEVLTAAGRGELGQALRILAPEAHTKPDRLRFHVTADTAFEHRVRLAELPSSAAVVVHVGSSVLALVRAAGSGLPGRLEVRPGLLVEVDRRQLFDEIAFQLGRRIERAQVRTLALEPGGGVGAPRSPRIDASSRHALPDPIDPGHLGRALAGLSGQTVLLSGRMVGDRLLYKPSRGPDGALTLAEIGHAMAAGEANVVVLAAASPRQPGSRNWLWQTVAVSNLERAVARPTLGELAYALAGEPKALVVRAASLTDGRIELELRPERERGPAPVAPIADAVAGTWSDLVSETAGALAVEHLRASLVSQRRQAELDRRIVPGIPSLVQIVYVALVAAGLVAWRRLRSWWARLWPPERREDYRGGAGHHLARLARECLFVLLFLPAAGLAGLAAVLLGALRRGLGALRPGGQAGPATG